MTKPTGQKMGRPAKYVKPFLKTYRVSQDHIERVDRMMAIIGVNSASDVIEEAGIVFERHLEQRAKRRVDHDGQAGKIRQRR